MQRFEAKPKETKMPALMKGLSALHLRKYRAVLCVLTWLDGCAGDAECGLLHSQHRDEQHGRLL